MLRGHAQAKKKKNGKTDVLEILTPTRSQEFSSWARLIAFHQIAYSYRKEKEEHVLNFL